MDTFALHADDLTTQLGGWEEQEPADTFMEDILLRMWDGDADAQTKTPSKKDAYRARNRECARQSRASDRVYTELMLAELNNLAETLDMYAAYIGQLQLHGACAAQCTHGLELCSTHKVSIALVQQSEVGSAAHTLFGLPTKERNRIHAHTSRCRKSNFLMDIVTERDASLSRLQELLQYTSTLESSCSLLNDFGFCESATVSVFLNCAEMRQRLLQRTCTHAQQSEHLKSHTAYRTTYRVNAHAAVRALEIAHGISDRVPHKF